MIDQIPNIFGEGGVKLELIEDQKMASSEAYRIVPTVEDQAYKLKIFYSAQAKIDQDSFVELTTFLTRLKSKFPSPYSLFELYYNAKAQDFLSLQVLAKIRKASFVKDNFYILPDDYYTRSQERLKYWENINEKFNSVERVYNKQVKKEETARRAVMDTLDKAVDSEQFRSLVARNDRKGAANLLRKYLPWEQMPPFEKLFWETHLDIMANPLPLEDRVLVYRGINDDIIQVAEEGGKLMSRTQALEEQKIFLMSTMMTKNQGTWNRRLRSLTAMYEKFMGTDLNGVSEFTKASRITTMFYNHSRDPKGSPFLSYTPKFGVARNFGSKRNTVYFVDPRMIYFNYASAFPGEVEFLLPIISFPDDLAAIWDRELHPNGSADVEKFLKENAIEKLNRELGGAKGTATYERILKNSEKFFSPVLAGKKGAVVVPDAKFINLFKKLLGKPTAQVAKELTPESNMTCLDLIQLFW